MAQFGSFPVHQNYCAYSALLEDPLLTGLRKDTAFNEVLALSANAKTHPSVRNTPSRILFDTTPRDRAPSSPTIPRPAQSGPCRLALGLVV